MTGNLGNTIRDKDGCSGMLEPGAGGSTRTGATDVRGVSAEKCGDGFLGPALRSVLPWGVPGHQRAWNLVLKEKRAAYHFAVNNDYAILVQLPRGSPVHPRGGPREGTGGSPFSPECSSSWPPGCRDGRPAVMCLLRPRAGTQVIGAGTCFGTRNSKRNDVVPGEIMDASIVPIREGTWT